ncbi:unannotated protein [freshwater metagenome]|uniref:Unannotated protein n=1 Tax=freshwater metagenome TaxID=449393 RepID=A0A6J6C523_9ZZZZ
MVGVNRWVSEGDQRRCVVEESTDVPAGNVGQTGVTELVVEQRLAVLPQGLVGVHT